ncbi:TraR/DksA family transcriptional regulator [Nitrosomonas sp. Nm33]|uniref:TraR/DksA family transcriptional regulator n=1 Tax=Nitrosomonas sp. Nm33 TaxID=133724 RepID=UPI00089C91BD|nr:TraR/DksA family transcriptional regulator [Nitrosomonas sp. Nm33]SDZ09116.1 RNA polymerase-binding transcription factor DksA [Nitrosomonas sp. Nm33]
MTQLTENEIESIENKLRERQQDLLEEVRNELDERENQYLAAMMGNDPGDSCDFSLADVLVDLNIVRVDRQINELREIESKLAQTKKGNMNECIECGKEIGLQRLLAYPTAMRCMSCQERREQMYAYEGHSSL